MDSDMLFLASSIYFLVACLFIAETYFEGEKSDAGWDAWCVLGLAAGLVWPLYILIVFSFLAFSDRSKRRAVQQVG